MKNSDIFGQSVQLTFRGESTYKSNIGGAASLVFFAIMSSLIAHYTVQFVQVENSNTSLSDIIREEYSMNLYELNYRFAIEKIDSMVGNVTAK